MQTNRPKTDACPRCAVATGSASSWEVVTRNRQRKGDDPSKAANTPPNLPTADLLLNPEQQQQRRRETTDHNSNHPTGLQGTEAVPINLGKRQEQTEHSKTHESHLIDAPLNELDSLCVW